MEKNSRGKIRLATAAGQFYPEDRKELAKVIDGLLDAAGPDKIDGDVFGLMLPHASYDFSGRVAAEGIKTIVGKKFDTVVIVGDSHYEYFDGVSVWPEGFWETPLGRVEVDDNLAKKIMAYSGRIFQKDSAHIFEHSIEVQIPFLQRALEKFKILPLIIGSENKDWEELAEVIVRNTKGKRVLIIVSADLSHYLPYGEAKKIDKKTLKNVLNLKVRDLNICAIDSVKTLIEITKILRGGASQLKYANSGEAPAGDKFKTVGYGAVAFWSKISMKNKTSG